MSPLALAVSLISLATPAAERAPEPIRPLRVEQQVEPSKVKIGEPFTRTVAITHPPEQRWELIAPRDPGDFEVLHQARRRDDRVHESVTTFSLRMAAFALGTLTLPPLELEVWTGEGPRVFASEPSSIEVIATLPDEVAREGGELHDIRPPEQIAVPSYTLGWILLAAAALVALGYLAWRRWRQPRPARLAPPPLEPLEVRTRQALRALAAENLPAQGRFKQYYVRLSEIVRGYLGERFGVEALECTSSELLAALGGISPPGLPREQLGDFLSDSDLVKFARAQRGPDDCARALDFAYLLVTRTTAPPLPTDAARRELP